MKDINNESKAFLARRKFISSSILGLGSMSFFSAEAGKGTYTSNASALKPPALKTGDTVGLVCPAHSAFIKQDVQFAVEALEVMGFKAKIGKHVFDRHGYLAGKDADRAADINEMFGDKSVNAIMAMHGGWGSARLLPLLDYKLIQNNPKVFIGYSDITSLLLAIYKKTGLVTFHGPVGSSTWNSFSTDYFRKTLISGEAVEMVNPVSKKDNLVQTDDRIYTITPGKASGKLLGGNLTVLSHILGSAYVPDFKGAILFLEDVGEQVYRMDRMLTQLKLAGILDQISGFIFGKCSECPPSKESYGSLTLEDIFEDHIRPLNIPAFSGSMIGHISNKFTVPVGLDASFDASSGVIRLAEPAVK